MICIWYPVVLDTRSAAAVVTENPTGSTGWVARGLLEHRYDGPAGSLSFLDSSRLRRRRTHRAAVKPHEGSPARTPGLDYADNRHGFANPVAHARFATCGCQITTSRQRPIRAKRLGCGDVFAVLPVSWGTDREPLFGMSRRGLHSRVAAAHRPVCKDNEAFGVALRDAAVGGRAGDSWAIGECGMVRQRTRRWTFSCGGRRQRAAMQLRDRSAGRSLRRPTSSGQSGDRSVLFLERCPLRSVSAGRLRTCGDPRSSTPVSGLPTFPLATSSRPANRAVRGAPLRRLAAWRWRSVNGACATHASG
jgi:hypothetical protein